jgi:hypothetical protein
MLPRSSLALTLALTLALALAVSGTGAHGQGACMQYVHYGVLRFYQFVCLLL